MPKKGEFDLQKLKYWKAVLADFERSGLTGQEYCRQKGIVYTAFANRRRRLTGVKGTGKYQARKAASKQSELGNSRNRASAQVGFVEVRTKSSIVTPSNLDGERLEVALPTGTVLRVPNGYSIELLARLVTALEVH